ncbi:putative zinc-binding metallopeptidase [Glaciecola siphonariae]|uniref:Zinc-binding metallopeptidase n=1 Tax=Glaciecola siphonariae TaxID=521012 RepID=A0ABV9LZA4_9ALTE
MKTFVCRCDNTLHFPNTSCVRCHSVLGFLPDVLELAPVNQLSNSEYESHISGNRYHKCINYSEHDVCNWMVDTQDNNPLCRSCRLTQTIPNLGEEKNLKLWFNLESSKRRLLYTLMKLNLPVVSKQEDATKGIGFAFLEDQTEDAFGNELFIKQYVTTGHSGGLITININEADPSARIEMREKMQERYRTLLGHFRHESGHYYWNCLIENSPFIEEYRELFGDERIDYQQAMQSYYNNGPANNWQNVWISAYASMHPWEDWAETWAHYMHMVDTLETANQFKFSIAGSQLANPLHAHFYNNALTTEKNFTKLFDDWCKLTAALNALNRSMGLDDAYPFVISISALKKLRFVHRVIEETSFTRDD